MADDTDRPAPESIGYVHPAGVPLNFVMGNEVIMTMDQRGLWYNGQLVQDGGEAYSMMRTWLVAVCGRPDICKGLH